jgi:hypothetical protein
MKLRVTAVHPTLRTDGSALVLDHWRLRYMKDGAGGYTAGPAVVPASTTADTPDVLPGEHWTVVVDWFDSDGQVSTGLAGDMLIPATPPMPAPPAVGSATLAFVA